MQSLRFPLFLRLFWLARLVVLLFLAPSATLGIFLRVRLNASHHLIPDALNPFGQSVKVFLGPFIRRPDHACNAVTAIGSWLASDEVALSGGIDVSKVDVDEERGCCEGRGVQAGDLGSNFCLLLTSQGKRMLDFVEGHFELAHRWLEAVGLDREWT